MTDWHKTLAEWSKACDAATAGPWITLDVQGTPWNVDSEDGASVCMSHQLVGDKNHVTRKANANFIALARTALPEAIARIRELEAALEGMRAEHRGWCGKDDPDVGHCDCPIGPFNSRIDAALGKP